MNKKTEQDPFNAFNWDEESTEIDFFGEVEKNMAPEKEEEEEVEVVEKEEETSKNKEEDKEEENVFEDFENLDDDKEEEEDVAPLKKTTTNIKESVKHLFEEGTLVLDEDEEVPEEIDNEYLTSKIEASIEKRFEEGIASLPDEVKNIIRFVNSGGALKDIISSVTQDTGISVDIDMDEEKNQEKVLKHLLKEEGEDDEFIEAQIEFFKDSGKLSSISKKKFERWKKNKDLDSQKLIEEQKRTKVAARENQARFKKEIGVLLSENPEIKGLNFSQKEIQDYPSYISDTSVKLQDGRSITPFYRDLFESLKNPEELLAIAKLVKTKFDFSDIKKDINTKQSKKLKEDLQRQSENTPKKRSSHKKRLIDLLDD